ncbi:MAG: disulfide isomerase DsbC N-terminal domain-containing protein [Thermoplasmata archaeon]
MLNLFKNSFFVKLVVKRKVISVLIVFLLLIASLHAYAFEANSNSTDINSPKEVEKSFLSIFPKTKNIASVKETPIKGLWAIIFSNKIPGMHNIIYFYPQKKLIFFGEIWNKDGQPVDFVNQSSK